MSTFFKEVRKLKISANFIRAKWSNSTKPKLILSGDWMQSAGFDIGENVEVQVQKNKLIITKIISHDN